MASGLRPVAVSKQAQIAAQSGSTIGWSVGQTRSGCVAMYGKSLADPIRGLGQVVVGQLRVEADDHGIRVESSTISKPASRKSSSRPGVPRTNSRFAPAASSVEIDTSGGVGRSPNRVRRGVDADFAQMVHVLGAAARAVVGHEAAADSQPLQTGKKRQRLRKEIVPEIDRAVHIEDDVANFGKVRHRVHIGCE